ncbi:MAG: hypothetical protein ACE367_25555 [Acidimicrobiales bacterium]
METEGVPTIDPDTIAEVEAILGVRVTEDPAFAAAVIADPAAVLTQVLAEVTGLDHDLGGVTVVLEPAAAAALGELHDAEVSGYTSPIPYPDIGGGGIVSAGGATCTIHQGGGTSGSGGTGVTKAMTAGMAQFVSISFGVKAEFKGSVGGGPSILNN